MGEHSSNSTPQQKAEPKLLRMLSGELRCIAPLSKKTIPVGEKAKVEIDGFSAKRRILCEVYAHMRKLIGGQPKKIASDILKLLLVEKRLGGKWRKILLFQDMAACKCLKGTSWLAEVCRENNIKIIVVEDKRLKKIVFNVQQRQKMTNV